MALWAYPEGASQLMELNAKRTGSNPDAEGVMRRGQGNFLVLAGRIGERMEELDFDGAATWNNL
jgi:hypothetical protein